jgi:imidazolonepropionase-like amidohydrolase
MMKKLDRVKDAGQRAVAIAKAHGIPIAFGTDLLGAMHPQQSIEWKLRAPVQTPIEILQSATSVAAKVLNQEGKLGVIAPGALADLVVVEGDPTKDATILCNPASTIAAIMKDGKWEKNAIST